VVAAVANSPEMTVMISPHLALNLHDRYQLTTISRLPPLIYIIFSSWLSYGHTAVLDYSFIIIITCCEAGP